jgi:hypothetical protein
MPNARTTYRNFFAGQIMSAFYSPSISSAAAMDCADKFRNEEWRVIGDAPYAQHTRVDLYELGLEDESLSEFIIDVINCMQYNLSMVE